MKTDTVQLPRILRHTTDVMRTQISIRRFSSTAILYQHDLNDDKYPLINVEKTATPTGRLNYPNHPDT